MCMCRKLDLIHINHKCASYRDAMIKLCIKVNASIKISSFRRSCYTDLTEDVPINILGQSFCADLVTMIYVATRLGFCISKYSILIKFIIIAVLH